MRISEHEKEYCTILKENIRFLNINLAWVSRSYDQCRQIGIKNSYSTDMLVNQALRCLDAVELTDSGTIIDILNRAEKRGIVKSAETLHDLKDLRNEIAHEYQIEQIERFFESVLKSTPVLLGIIDNLQTYSEKYTHE